jgi:hypothetical protein
VAIFYSKHVRCGTWAWFLHIVIIVLFILLGIVVVVGISSL